MFTKADMALWPSVVDRAVSYAAAVGRRDRCIALSRSRLDVWTRLWPEAFNEFGPAWTAFIETRSEQFFAIWTEELAEMHESAEDWLQTFRSYLEALDEPNGSAFLDVLAQSYLAIDADGSRLIATNQGSIGRLTGGYSWGAHAPWD